MISPPRHRTSANPSVSARRRSMADFTWDDDSRDAAHYRPGLAGTRQEPQGIAEVAYASAAVDAAGTELVLQQLQRRFLRVAPRDLGGVIAHLGEHVLFDALRFGRGRRRCPRLAADLPVHPEGVLERFPDDV